VPKKHTSLKPSIKTLKTKWPQILIVRSKKVTKEFIDADPNLKMSSEPVQDSTPLMSLTVAPRESLFPTAQEKTTSPSQNSLWDSLFL